MTWQLSYYNAKVAATIEASPVGIRARFLRIVEVMIEHGPDLGMPHTRAMGVGLFEIRAKSSEGIGRVFLLHRGRATHRAAACLHQEDRKDSRARP